jgi:hypothetical protein
MKKKQQHIVYSIELEDFIDKKQEFILNLYDELFTKKIKKEEKELEVLIDKFEIHTQGKEIILENMN